MAGRSPLDGPKGTELRAAILAMLDKGATITATADAVGLSARTIMRARDRDDDFGQQLKEAVQRSEETQQRMRAERAALDQAAVKAAKLPEEPVAIVVPEVLQRPENRLREGDKPLPQGQHCGRSELLDILSAGARDPESPIHGLSVAKLCDLLLAGEIESAKAEAKLVAKLKAAAGSSDGTLRRVLVVYIPEGNGS